MNALRIFGALGLTVAVVSFLKAEEPKPRFVLKIDPDEPVQSICFSPDSKLVAVGLRPGVQIWDVSSGKKVAGLARAEAGKARGEGVRALAYSTDGKLLAAGGDRAVHVWDTATGKSLAILQGNTNVVASVAVSPDGKLVAAAGDRTARIWDIASGKAQAVIEHATQTSNVAYSPDGKRLTVADFGRLIRIWDPAAPKEALDLKGHVGFVFDLVYRSDGKVLASASKDGTVRLWNPANGQITATLRHKQPVRSVAFRPGGKEIIAADEGRVILWNAAGKELARSPALMLEALSVALDGSGSYLAVSRLVDGDSAVVLWETSVLLGK